MNWLDLVLVILFILNILSGWQTGLIGGLAELVSLLISIFFAVVALPHMASILRSMGFSANWSLFIGFGFVFVLAQIVLALATTPFTKRLKKTLKDSVFGTVNKALGPIPHIVAFFITTSFMLATFLVFPIFAPMRASITNSRFGLSLAAPAVSVLDPVAAEFKHND
jgi:uncharacterized membrane protein required for colicin V production